MLSWLQHRWTGLWLMFMALGAIITFLYGFFPLKYNSGKFAHLYDLPNFIEGVSIDGHTVYDSGDNSVVLMVIDGLRYDFVTEEYMPYTGQLLKNKTGCIYVSVAEPPTVTMPRIKAMMTGSISTFADVALNFGAPAVRGDSVLRVADARGRRSILYGDDTWLRLFPGLWAEYDGTTSFYVTDYTEVDNNVTRHLDKVLKVDENNKTKFDFLVLHYLGLDHIGHLEGARSEKIKPKLHEMDLVVKKIFEAMLKWDRKGILFICGDHGMRDAGGHGGATPAEVLVPLVVVKSSDFACPHPAGVGPTVGQVDLAPTIAWLLNAPPPGDSVGRILPSLLPIDMRQHLYLLHVIASHNVRQGVPTDLEFYKQFQRAEKQFAHFLSTGEQSAAKIAKEFYEESLTRMVTYLTESTVEFDMFAIVMAIVLLYFNTCNLDWALGPVMCVECIQRLNSLPKDAAEGTGKYGETIWMHSNHSGLILQWNIGTRSVEAEGGDLFPAVGQSRIVTSLICVTLYSIQPENQRKDLPRQGHHRTTKAGSVVAFIIILIIITIVLTISCYITETKSKICSFNPIWATAFILLACAFTTTYFIIKSGIEKIKDLSTLKELNAIDYLLIIGTLFHSWSFFGTSFIEEEHMTWYFFWNTLMFFVLIRTIVLVVMYLSKHLVGATEVQEKPELKQRISEVGMGILPKWVLLIALHRYLRTMNQTGDRWLFLPDTADWLNSPENAFYLQAHLVIGTLATAAICYKNLSCTNNIKQIHTILTTVAVAAIFCYRISSSALTITPLDEITTWDHVSIVNIFWGALISQFVIEVLSFAGIFKSCGIKVAQPRNKLTSLTTNTFDYYTPKEKVEDYLETVEQEPWNIDDVKLALARSLLHLMLNAMMLIVALLMRPHNVVMVPSIYVTCVLTTTCMEHKMLDSKSMRKTDVVDVLSKTLVHIWIGVLFFFYQGNSNSLASVDLGSGYVGLREYCPVRVAMRMGLHAYAGPALAGALLFCTIATNANSWQQYLKETWQAVNIFAAHRVYCLTIYCVIAAVFRHHLYVWTVFSPKLLYDFVAVLFTIQALGTIANVEAMTHATSWLARYASYKRRL